MTKVAEIVDDIVWCVFDWDLRVMPEYAPPRIAVDITGLDPQPRQGWKYDPATGAFSALPEQPK